VVEIEKSKLDSLVQILIPPLLILLMVVSIWELFFDASKYLFFIDIFDFVVIAIFAIDLYYRWFETPHIIPYVRKHFLDIIATIPFNLIFLGVDHLIFTRALRGGRIIARAGRAAKLVRFSRLLRLTRFVARAPRFLRMRKHLKPGKIRKKQPHEHEMKGVLSFKVILIITINSIMGTGIWFLTAAGAKHAGPASLISWGILSLISVYIAMCFSELTAMFPKAGGVYEFAKQAYGRFWSFVIGWTTSIAGSVTIAMLLLGAMQYLIPLEYSAWYVPISIGLLVLFNYVAYRGMQTSTVMLVSFAAVTFVTVIAILIPNIFSFNLSNLTPFFVFPSMSIILSIFFIAETFFGWESAVFLSAETKNPSKVMPRALIWGTVIIAALAFLLAATSIGIIPWEQFGETAAPLSALGEAHFGGAGNIIFTLLVFVSIIGAVACWVVTAPRLLMSLAEDKLFFVQFGKIHPKHKSPYVSIVFQVIIISGLIFVGAGNYETLLHMLIPLILFVYSAVLLSVVMLRIRQPMIPRPYRVIFGKIGPLLTILFMGFLLYMFIHETHGALDVLRVSGALILFGIPAYFFIEIFYDDKYVSMRKDSMARFKHIFHQMGTNVPRFNHIMNLVGTPNKNHVVVDLNSELGIFTHLLHRKGIKYKKVYTVHNSDVELEIFKEKVHKDQKKKVTPIKVSGWAIPKQIKKADKIVGFGVLGNVKDIDSFLKQLHNTLKPGGHFCFHIKHHMLDVSPNALFVNDKKQVENAFKKAKLHVSYKKLKHVFKEEIFIHGYK
tara:strand:+ start:725 stop:3061 length:2337 start_codon:yes stop_codon:yes gene_type:complete